MDVVELVNKYGFPIVMAVGMGFIIKYVWEWATKEFKPVIGEANIGQGQLSADLRHVADRLNALLKRY